MSNRLDPDLLADVHILFTHDRSKLPQFICTKPDGPGDPADILHIMNGCLAALASFGETYKLGLQLRCPSCSAQVPLLQPRPPDAPPSP